MILSRFLENVPVLDLSLLGHILVFWSVKALGVDWCIKLYIAVMIFDQQINLLFFQKRHIFTIFKIFCWEHDFGLSNIA